ncbi:MAG: Ig-like domain-containing protein [Treponemataceae bacterium]|nr:Ig-like domain-containing protein [Treponemataceae bacterium]
MKKITWAGACMAAVLALLVIGCEQDPAPVVVERVMLNMTELTLMRGETARLTAAVMPENADNKTVTWQSSDTSVVTVGNDGTVTAVNAGTATITARAGDKTAVCAVTVNEITVNPEPVAVESVALDKETLTLMRGETGKLTATVLPENANGRTVAWSSSDEAVVTVGNDGTVTAHSAGTATVTAQAGDKTAACAVTVNPIPVTDITLSAPTLTLTPGTTSKLTATVMPENADDTTVTWSSSDEAVVTVGNDGTVTTIAEGTVTITAKAGGKAAECTVSVKQILNPVESVALNKAALTLTRGDTEQLTATVTPSNADDKTVAWSSSKPDVATVDADGTVTTHKAGETTITATTQEGGKTATCAVTVNPIHVTDITLNTTTLTLMRGATGTLTATVMPDNADDKTVTWQSSDTAVATVDADGTVTAVKQGAATITATTRDSGMTATCEVTVKPVLIAVESVTFNKKTLTLICGETERLMATVMPSNADDKTVAWSSSNAEIAMVSDDGTVAARKVGTARITASAGGKEAECTVTVNSISVENVTLNK